jgi:thioesterase domain-containing protein
MLYGEQNSQVATAQQVDTAQQDPTVASGPNTGLEIYPASLAQERLWFLDQLRENSAAYNVHVGLWLRGALDIAALRQSWREIVKRHDAFRTTFRFVGGTLLQIVAPHAAVDLSLDNVLAGTDPVQSAYQLACSEVEQPFDLAKGPLFRVRVIRVFPEDHVLLCTMHHIVTDSWSMQLLVKELTALYAGFASRELSLLPDLAIRYGDYAEWQREWFGSDIVHRQTSYWKDKLGDAPKSLELPKDKARPSEQSFNGANITTVLAETVVEKVKRTAARYNCTPFIVLLSAFKVLLYRYSGQPDVLVGVPVAGRNRIETEGLIGFFVNTLVLRDKLSGKSRFLDILAQVRETTLAAFANADVPFERLVEVLQPERNLSFNPIFQVMFSAIKAAVQTHAFGNLVAYPYVVSGGTSMFDLSAALIENTDGQWCLQLEYNTDLFTPERMAKMLDDYTLLIRTVVENPAVCVCELPFGVVEQPTPLSSLQISEDTHSQHQVADSAPDTVTAGTFAERADIKTNRELLTGIWKEVLAISQIGIHDNFFDMGGHSLLAARLVREIGRAMGQSIRVSAIFKCPTIDSFARLLAQPVASASEPTAVELGRGENLDPIFTVAIPGVETFGFAVLAHQLQGKHSVYRLQAAEPVILGRPFSANELASLAEEYISALRKVQPHGPYNFAAMCDGVVLAQAIVLALEAQGEQVTMFAIFDTWVLENTMSRPLWAVDYYLQRLRAFCNLAGRDRWATIKRVMRRLFSRKQQQTGSGWNRAYWPNKTFAAPQFRAPVLLFKRPRQPYFYIRDPHMGWGARTRSGVEICELKSGHTEMLREPHVRIVGERISSFLEKAHRDNLQNVLTPAHVQNRTSTVFHESAA